MTDTTADDSAEPCLALVVNRGYSITIIEVLHAPGGPLVDVAEALTDVSLGMIVHPVGEGSGT